MSQKFTPSNRSEPPKGAERTSADLRYLGKATSLLERHVETHGDVPPWVKARINQATIAMGMAVSYVIHQQESKERKK